MVEVLVEYVLWFFCASIDSRMHDLVSLIVMMMMNHVLVPGPSLQRVVSLIVFIVEGLNSGTSQDF